MNTDKGQFGSMNVFRKGNLEDTMALAARAKEQQQAFRDDSLTKSNDASDHDEETSGRLGARLASRKTVHQATRAAKDGLPLSVSGAELAKARAPKSTRGRTLK
jgi:hypothetical protein